MIGNGSLVVFGGVGERATYLNDLYCLDLDKMEWRKVEPHQFLQGELFKLVVEEQ